MVKFTTNKKEILYTLYTKHWQSKLTTFFIRFIPFRFKVCWQKILTKKPLQKIQVFCFNLIFDALVEISCCPEK